MTTVATELTDCLNCGTAVHGHYCTECGQKSGGANPTLHDLLHDLSHELLHVDGKIFQSVWLLLARPGFLTREYVAGRRVRHVSPLRLYLLFSVIYFGMIALAPAGPTSGFRVTYTPSRGESEVEERAAIRRLGFETVEELQEAARETLGHWIPRAMFLLVPVFAALVALTTRKSGRNYPHHLYFALHLHAVWFALGAVAAAAAFLRPPPLVVGIQAATIVHRVVYTVLAFRTVYNTTAAGAVWRAAAVSVAYLIAVLAALAAIVGAFIAAHRLGL